MDIGNGRKIIWNLAGSGSPTVVQVAGLTASAEDWLVADKSAPAAFPEVANFTGISAYDSPAKKSCDGYGPGARANPALLRHS
jgi:hypothetical protein